VEGLKTLCFIFGKLRRFDDVSPVGYASARTLSKPPRSSIARGRVSQETRCTAYQLRNVGVTAIRQSCRRPGGILLLDVVNGSNLVLPIRFARRSDRAFSANTNSSQTPQLLSDQMEDKPCREQKFNAMNSPSGLFRRAHQQAGDSARSSAAQTTAVQFFPFRDPGAAPAESSLRVRNRALRISPRGS
jgi:hypothetical protein